MGLSFFRMHYTSSECTLHLSQKSVPGRQLGKRDLKLAKDHDVEVKEGTGAKSQRPGIGLLTGGREGAPVAADQLHTVDEDRPMPLVRKPLIDNGDVGSSLSNPRWVGKVPPQGRYLGTSAKST